MSAKIIIADDHSLIRIATAQLINLESDMECIAQCESIDEARSFLENQVVDLAICDLQFKSGNVLDLISGVRGQSNVKFLVFTAHRPGVFAPLCELKGAHGFMHKSNSPEEMIQCIRDVLSGTKAFVKSFETNPDDNIASNLSRLSDREWQVLLEIGIGMSTKEIAKRLFLSDKTIESHRLAIKRKLGVTSKDQLTAFATEVSSVLAPMKL